MHVSVCLGMYACVGCVRAVIRVYMSFICSCTSEYMHVSTYVCLCTWQSVDWRALGSLCEGVSA